ncbi:MAG: Ger(x)C family spore germination protein [Clostridia bacterium]|nr:Ger(x)C family spore germination protein [Clostridia bacterium]
MIKKLIIIFIININIFILFGCWNYTEIDDQIIVTGIAVDKGMNGKKYHLTVEIIDTSEGENNSGIKTVSAEADGNTLFSALRNMIAITSKKLYIGHCRVIVLSEEVAKEGLQQLIDFAIRDHEIRKNIDIIITKGLSSNEILNQKGISEAITMYGIVDLLDNNENSLSQTERARVSHVINTLGTDAASPVMPSFNVEKTKEYTSYKLSGVAVFNKDKLVGFLDNEETTYYLFAVNKINGGIISIKMDDKEDLFVGVEIFKNTTDYKPVYKDGKLTLNINTETTVGIAEIGKDVAYIEKSGIEKVRNQLEVNLQVNIESIIKKVQKEYESDIFGFSSIIDDQNPKLWEKLKNNWDEIYSALEINVKSKIIVRGTGTAKDIILMGE